MTLVINYLEIENFKSYYGKNTLGPFHQSFNAVIGPNGSGKSNVIDSLLFVFGFRAQKIRSKKLSVLIHNSDQHPNVNSCSVTIFFRKIREAQQATQGGPVKYEVVPNSDFTVKRTVYKDNSSEYYIDGQKVQYKEVAQLLRDCGVDLDHNRFLILQGEVEQISLLKPKAANEHEEGLLEYLEDIIGTIKYKPMLEEISVEIEKVNEIRTEKNNRVLNLEKDKQALVAPRNAALAFLKQENQLIEKKNVYFQYRINQTGKNVQEQTESLSGVQGKYDQMEKEIGELNKANEVQSIEWNLKKKECDKKMKQKEKIKAKFEEYEKEDVELRESIKHAQESIKKLEKTVDNETQKIENLRELPEKNEKKIEELKETLQELEDQLEPANKKLQAKMEQVNEETRQYHEKKDALKDKLNELQTKANEAKAKMDLAQTELDVYLNNQNADKNKLEELRAKIAHTTRQVAEREDELKELKTQKIPQWEKEYKKASDEMASLNEQDTKLSEMVKKNRSKFTEAQSSFSSNRNRNRVLNFLMQMQSEGRLSGVFGRLGDLGAIEEKYDVAISTACGALDCIVVENIDTAQKCVETLKANNVGSATFIALDKQDKWRDQVQRKPKTPENVPRLVDLIQPVDPKFMTAFYYSLRNTLVGENLDQATRIAYNASQRNRVVTLKGEIIEVSGTMSGGGQPQKGRMGSRVVSVEAYTADSIKRMQESIQVDENELRKVVERKRQLEPILEDLRTKLEKGRDDLVRWQNELNTLKEQIKVNKATEADLAKRVKESGPGDVGAQRELEEVVERMREQFEKADKNAAKLREENDSLHNKIVEITKKLLDDPKAHLKRLETTINENKTLMTNLSVEIKTSKRNLANSEKKLASHREDLEQAQSQLAKSQKRLEDIDEEGKEMVEQFDKIKTECDQLEAEVKELVKKMKEEDGKLQKYEKEKIDMKYNLEKLGQELHDENQRLKHFQTALNGLKLHNIDRLMNNTIDEDKEKEKYELKKIDEEDFEGLDDEHLKKEIHKLEENLKEQTPNLNIIEKFNEIEKKFMERMEELEKVTEERDALCNKYEEVRKTRFDEFMGGFTKIRLKLKEIYRTVTLEGDAELELVDSMDPFTEGIVLSVRPPKKSWKNVSNLSGGEKTLSSLSLVFALHEFRATPIYVMDEIDAALDFKNVSIIAHYIKERTRNAQFIIISLRNNMFELCDRLFGIYKVKNCTSAAYISPDLLELDEKKKQTQSSRNKMAMAATTKSLNQLVGSSNSHEDTDNKKTENDFVNNNENVSMIN